jgi:hypothetical protein
MTVTEGALLLSAGASMLSAVAGSIGIIISSRNGRKLDSTISNVSKIEIATNSMKDALVASTAKASYAEGVAEGRAYFPPPHKTKVDRLNDEEPI